MIDIESKIISYREDTNDYRLCLTREDIDEIKNAWNDGYYQGATQMEEAKQIIIDSLLKQMEHIRAEAIEECIELVADNTCMYGCTEDDCIPCTIKKMEHLKEQK